MEINVAFNLIYPMREVPIVGELKNIQKYTANHYDLPTFQLRF